MRANNPVMTAAWDSGPGTEIGGTGKTGVLTAFIDTDPPDADYYLYHYNTFRVGASGDGPMPSQVRVASANGGVDTIGVKRWTSTDGKGFPAPYAKDFTTDYVDPQQAYTKIRALNTEFPNLSQIFDLPNKTNGYQRKSQALLGLKTPYTNATGSISTALVDQAVILTRSAWGQNGGNNLTAQLKDPAPTRWASPSPARRSRSTVATRRSTAADVLDAVNASADAAALVTASKYRTNTGLGKSSPKRHADALSDFLARRRASRAARRRSR